jgi:hypothetical protein
LFSIRGRMAGASDVRNPLVGTGGCAGTWVGEEEAVGGGEEKGQLENGRPFCLSAGQARVVVSTRSLWTQPK